MEGLHRFLTYLIIKYLTTFLKESDKVLINIESS